MTPNLTREAQIQQDTATPISRFETAKPISRFETATPRRSETAIGSAARTHSTPRDVFLSIESLNIKLFSIDLVKTPCDICGRLFKGTSGVNIHKGRMHKH